MLSTASALRGLRPKTGARLSAAFINHYNGLLATLRRDALLNAFAFSPDELWDMDYVLRHTTELVNTGKPGVLVWSQKVERDLSNVFNLTLTGKYEATGDYPDVIELVDVILFRDWLFLTLEKLQP